MSSLITPFALGAAAGGITTGHLRADGSSGLFAPFLTPLPLVSGLLAVASCAFLAAVYLTTDAHADPALVRRLRVRALGSGATAGALALAALPLLPADFAARLPWPPVAASVVCGALALELMRRGRFTLARIAAAGAPAGLLTGWAFALYPWVLPGSTALVPPSPTVAGLMVGVLFVGLLLVIPSYVFMIRVLRR